MVGDAPQLGNTGVELPFVGDVPLTEERLRYLAPRLRMLVEDFDKLQLLERPDVGPATVPMWREGNDGCR